MSNKENVIVIGAGPCGIAAGIALQEKGLNPLLIEKGALVQSIYDYPTHMQFFSTPDLLEVGNIPFVISRDKPTRLEALNYYRNVVERKNLRVKTYEKVEHVKKTGEGFVVDTVDRLGDAHQYVSKYLVIATGYFDRPNYLNVPGEDLDKVSHYFKEAHPYHGLKVAVIGGKNSAIDAAMELEKVGADVTIIYRGSTYSESIKPWVRPVIESLVDKERIKVMWNARVKEIKKQSVVVEQDGEIKEIENDFVFALTGYRPNRKLLNELGVEVNEETGEPVHNPDTMETNVEGVYIAGVIAAGNNANVIFIENGRFHGGILADAIASKE
ncbi:MAG: YpdA family putative bacillithiol disulfide reductase [Bacillaceae bacterium]|nr:YpdA family putative bacillithiol disulfide reductase [Bacillaceae bacterium]